MIRYLRPAFGLLFALLIADSAVAQTMRVTLLGTGTPGPNPERFGPATLIEAGDRTLLIDAGRGATIRLGQVNVSPSEIDAIFVTHFHSDHLNGLADIWLLGYMPPYFREAPLRIIGPPGIRELAEGLQFAYRTDTESRATAYEDAGMPFHREGTRIQATEFNGEGVVFDQGGVSVEAIAVNHGLPAFAFRVTYAGRAVVISGDTSPSENLVEHARGVDLIVHEVMAISDEVLHSAPMWKDVLAVHTTPEQAGEIFRQIGPKMAAFNHIGLNGVDEDELAARTRAVYSGPLVVGRDLMTFLIGETVTLEQ